jgi:hypothetical protein
MMAVEYHHNTHTFRMDIIYPYLDVDPCTKITWY